jgi:rubrerythrin
MEQLTLTDIIGYSRVLEDNSRKFYLDAANIATSSAVKAFLNELADEELRHRNMLDNILTKFQSIGYLPKLKKGVTNLGYADYLPDVKAFDKNMTYQDIIVAGMKREKEAVQAYEQFSGYMDDTHIREIFLFLANEEKKHLRRFEEEYDNLLSDF